METRNRDLPLEGLLVLDCSRMLPGAVLARLLLDLGARLIKVEAPGEGDPMRRMEPLVDGFGAAFAAFYPGAESIALDFKDTDDQASFSKLAGNADVLIETFRPGTMESWNLGAESLFKTNPRLVYCSMSSWGKRGDLQQEIGHDLNFVAATGVLDLIGRSESIPALQIADVGASLLAASAILAALLRRERTGKGAVIDQPLAGGVTPLLAWAWADRAGGGGALETLLSGKWPCYRRYSCGDGRDIAVSTIQPKFWVSFLKILGLEEFSDVGEDPGKEGLRAIEAIGRELGKDSRDTWIQRFRKEGLPVSPVLSLNEALESGKLENIGMAGQVITPSGKKLSALGPFIPSLGETPGRPAPRINEHNRLPGLEK